MPDLSPDRSKDLFSKLPRELSDKILCHYSRADLAETRRVSRHFRKLAEPLLFRKVTFCYSSQSAENVASIIDSKHLRAYVREFCFSTQASLETLDVRSLDLPSFKDPKNANQISSPPPYITLILYQRRP